MRIAVIMLALISAFAGALYLDSKDQAKLMMPRLRLSLPELTPEPADFVQPNPPVVAGHQNVQVVGTSMGSSRSVRTDSEQGEVMEYHAATNAVLKCVDAAGRVTFTNVCPAGSRVVQIGTQGNLTVADAVKVTPQVQSNVPEGPKVASVDARPDVDRAAKTRICADLMAHKKWIHDQQTVQSTQWLREEDTRTSEQIDAEKCLQGR